MFAATILRMVVVYENYAEYLKKDALVFTKFEKISDLRIVFQSTVHNNRR